MPGFSVLPHLRNEGARVDVLLAIDAQESAACWQSYSPRRWWSPSAQAQRPLPTWPRSQPRRPAPSAAGVRGFHRLSAAAAQPPQAPAGQPRLVILPDAEIAALLARRGEIGEYLRARLARQNGDPA